MRKVKRISKRVEEKEETRRRGGVSRKVAYCECFSGSVLAGCCEE